ncbi:glycosyltransferase family 2 protein [Aquimarina sp. MMG015]|uniref:glycosyltransferase family 2 protein n=1 Tax=unclassified Aquimarina TaxID=2627091 RepID=UPI000E4F9C41|nr:glycosyltransferase family 2 protein [Aquimarina sp. AD1]AXT54860.1 glycosyltransferase family 2 protein [Aquimarina sp. AD1]MBQ4804726.1 glycosyltransferase family 2 protein [Aquimarina sp. MMG015]RKN12990.1 glycosyltransferase [Aquimarina sp. AD1]
MNIAIVILNWNGRSLLEQFLPSVVNHSEGASVYVADNASTDDSIEYIKTSFPEVQIIQNDSNGGYSKGYNDALSKVDADIYCLLNSDVEVTKNWLTPIAEAFKNSKKIGAIQPKILDYKKMNYFEYAGAAGGFIDKFGYPYCRGRIFDTLEEDKGQYDDTLDIFWASGACLFIRKSVFEEVDKLDEDFFAHQEEIDLCWRIQNNGYLIKYIGTSKVYHLGGATLNAMNPKKTFLNFRNSLLMIVKNTSGVFSWYIILVRLLLDGIAGVKFLLEGKPSHCLAILKAHFSFYKNLPTFVKKRKKSRATRKYYSVSSVVWQYYILNKKLFNHL